MNEQTFTPAHSRDAPGAAPGRPVQVALAYVVLGVAWILASDNLLLAMAPDVAALAGIGLDKGLAYVLVTGLLLYSLLARRDRQPLQPQDAAAQVARWRQ